MTGNYIEVKEQLAEILWLKYFNRVLFENQIITEQESEIMNTLIEERVKISSYE